MGEKFSSKMNAYFGSDVGAYSIVTDREDYDGQVTLTGAEKVLVLDFFGEAALAPYRGSADLLAKSGLDARREFALFPDGRFVYPKLNYPKSKGNELRLYFNKDEFSVSAGHYWGVFQKDGKIWLCNFSPNWLSEIENNPDIAISRKLLEPDDDDFQILLNEREPAQVSSIVTKWKRDPRISAESLLRSGFTCELRPDHPVFISRKSGKPYMEAHHLVPMGLQHQYDNLDHLDNICALSPFAHRLLHYGTAEEVIPEVRKLIKPRLTFIKQLGLIEDDVLAIYA
jgi:5-methylcytosine-specific restriction enzyme A